jgi:catechol 2,3-dioxygenase-like lactoylglutathione lyase family enzyme
MMFRLEMVTIPVSDIDRAKTFYAEQLGSAVDQDVQVDLAHRFMGAGSTRLQVHYCAHDGVRRLTTWIVKGMRSTLMTLMMPMRSCVLAFTRCPSV